MAAKKPKKPAPKPAPKTNKVPKTAAEKSAEASLTYAQQLGVAQTQARASQTSRGAYRPRTLRASGDMGRYNLARYKNDPFPELGLGGGPANAGGGTVQRTAGRTTVSSPKSPKPKKITLKQANKQQQATYDERARQAREAERQRKAAAAAARKKAKSVSDGTTTNAPAKGNTSKAM